MCLLVVAWRVIDDTPLLIGANRDEFLNRPAVAVAVLQAGGPRILGGRDEQSGGTWLAVNEHGVFAGLTNQPLGEQRDPTRRSRGELPLALATHRSAAEAVDEFVGRYSPAEYNGAYLLVGDRDSLFSIDFTGLVDVEARALPPGIHVLENRPLGTSSPKTDYVRRTLGDPVGLDRSMAALRQVLRDHHVADETRERPQTSANCVHLDEYGTRSSCMISVGESPDARPQLWVAGGAPCHVPYSDASHLW